MHFAVYQSVLLSVRALPRPALHKRKAWPEYYRIKESHTKNVLPSKMEFALISEASYQYETQKVLAFCSTFVELNSDIFVFNETFVQGAVMQ